MERFKNWFRKLCLQEKERPVPLFSSLNYREFIHEKIRQNKGTRGYRTQLAKAAACHTSYFSHMLKGVMGLSVDFFRI
jgi:hypothetical protein